MTDTVKRKVTAVCMCGVTWTADLWTTVVNPPIHRFESCPACTPDDKETTR